MKTPLRTAVLSLTAVAALAGLQACGGNDSGSDAAGTPSSTSSTSSTATPGSTESVLPTAPVATGKPSDLCTAFAQLPKALASTNEDTAVAAAHDFASKLQDAGPPSDMPSDAESGLQAYIAFIGGVSAEDVKKLENSKASNPEAIFGDKAADVQAFFQYVAQNCASAFGTQPTAPSTP